MRQTEPSLRVLSQGKYKPHLELSNDDGPNDASLQTVVILSNKFKYSRMLGGVLGFWGPDIRQTSYERK